MAFPPPWEHRLAERNLAAMWANYRDLGYRRMIYVNTVSVRVVSALIEAMGDDPCVTAVLLRCGDATARQRIGQREIGSALQRHIDRGLVFARELEERAPRWVHRVDTDGRAVAAIAAEVIGLTGWTA